MKNENKWFLMFWINLTGYTSIIVESFIFFFIIFQFSLGKMVLLYEFNSLIYNIELVLIIYTILFIMFKFGIFLKKSLIEVNLYE